jgi:TonB-dependent receptor
VNFEAEDAFWPIDGEFGLRVVRTDISITGNQRTEVGGVETFTPVSNENEYTDYLPSMNLRFRVTPDVQIRFAANKTRTRPTFAQLNPALNISPTVNPVTGRRSANGGNIELQPLESENFDLAFEYYFAATGSAQLTFFRRDVDGFIVDQVRDVDSPILGPLRITQPVNLNQKRLNGVETAFTTFFDYGFLPEWARGFGVQLNHTYIEGSLPGVSDNTANVIGMYERGPLSARLAYNFRSEYQRIGEPANEFREDEHRLDFSSSYAIRENITFMFDVSNILGTPYRDIGRYDGGAFTYPRDVSYEETIWSIGVRGNF